MPAVYDLANRGLLPPGFSLVGFARRDWADQDFAQVVHDSVKEHARTPFREEVWQQLAEGFRFVPGDFDDDVAFDTLRQTIARPRPGPRHRRQPRVLPVDPAAVLPRRDRPAQGARPRRRRGRTPGAGWSSRSRSAHDLETARELNAIVSRGLPAGVGVPHRPLPRQGDRPEHPRAALRQRDVRADLERQLRRPRADHDGRGHRHRRPGRLLRRHRRRPRRDPEPPAPADGADRDGGADLVRRARACASRSRRSSSPSCCPGASTCSTARGQYADGWAGGVKVPGYLEEADIPHDLAHRDLRRDPARHRDPALGRRAVLPAHRQAARPPGHRGRRGVQAGAAPAVQRDRDRGARPQRAGDPGPARRGRHAAVRLQGARHRDGDPRRQHGLRLRRLVHRVQPRRPTSG